MYNSIFTLVMHILLTALSIVNASIEKHKVSKILWILSAICWAVCSVCEIIIMIGC